MSGDPKRVSATQLQDGRRGDASSRDSFASPALPRQVPLTALNAAAALAGSPRGAGLVHRQTAILLGAGAGGGFRPLYHELSFNMAALTAQAQAEEALADPFLERHLAARLDTAMLGRSGRFLPRDLASLPLHVNLTIPTIRSPGFAAFAAAARDGRLGIEVPLVEAGADPEGFQEARRIVAGAGMALLLDGVSVLALLLARPDRLGADMVKLTWAPDLAFQSSMTQGETALAKAIAQIGPAGIVLQCADSEAALRWGMSLGIRRFQGRHVDAMLAASRILDCPVAAACSLPQCMARAAATLAAGRLGCGNPTLLDAGAAASAKADEPA